ncbi:unnamed protein product [Amoebophrya sp. A120]|nr:unnamed protein product [Amoebophrya sp. A120]|eukprot:GSA120T00019039001.1
MRFRTRTVTVSSSWRWYNSGAWPHCALCVYLLWRTLCARPGATICDAVRLTSVSISHPVASDERRDQDVHLYNQDAHFELAIAWERDATDKRLERKPSLTSTAPYPNFAGSRKRNEDMHIRTSEDYSAPDELLTQTPYFDPALAAAGENLQLASVPTQHRMELMKDEKDESRQPLLLNKRKRPTLKMSSSSSTRQPEPRRSVEVISKTLADGSVFRFLEAPAEEFSSKELRVFEALRLMHYNGQPSFHRSRWSDSGASADGTEMDVLCTICLRKRIVVAAHRVVPTCVCAQATPKKNPEPALQVRLAIKY